MRSSPRRAARRATRRLQSEAFVRACSHACDEIEYALTFHAIQTHPLRSLFLAIGAVVSLTACASKPAETGASPVALRPLERMAGQEIVVLPVQYLSATDTLGWQQRIPNRAAFLAAFDDQIESTLSARGLAR